MVLSLVIKKNKLTNYIMLTTLLVTLLVSSYQPNTATAATPLSLKWTGYVSGSAEALLIADVRSDIPGEEIFHAGSGGRVTCLNGRTGAQLWSKPISGIGDTCQIHMDDFDNDGNLEIVVPLQHPAGVYILHAEDGNIMFSENSLGGGRIDSSPVSGDIDNDGYPELYVGIMAYETQPETGKIIHYEWSSTANRMVERGRVQVWHPCAGGLSLSDTDNDGRVELYMNERDAYFGDGSWGRGIVSFWADTLEVRWQVYSWGASSNIPMLADVNKDGILDVVTTDLDNSVCVLNSTDGHPLKNYAGVILSGSGTGERRNHYQSSIYDFDADGNLEIASGDGFEGEYDFVTVWDLWDWKLDAMIDTTKAVMAGEVSAGGRTWKGPTFGEVTGDGLMDMLVVTYDHLKNSNKGTLQIYNHNYELVHVNTGLVHRAIDAVVQDVDRNDGGLNEVLVLTQGGVVYCFDTLGISEELQGRERVRSEVQFYSESRNGASEFIPYERPYPDVGNPLPEKGAVGVSTHLASLSFSLNHPYGELMDYVITSSPHIASATVKDIGNGQRSVSVNGPLAENTLYHWQIVATDESGHVTAKDYSFTTEPYLPNNVPTQATPDLVGGSILENLVAAPQETVDADGDTITNIYNWQKDGVSIASINLPFDTRTEPVDEYSGFATTKDYAYGTSGSVFGARWVPDGKVGGAYSFDGNDFIRIEETNNRFDGGGSRNAMSIECWVKATMLTNTERLILKQNRYDDNDVGQPRSYRLDYRNSGSQLEFTWQVGIGPLREEGEYTTYTLGPYNITSGISDWHHIVCTYKSGIGLRLYVDGIEATNELNQTYSGNILNTNGPFEIAFGRGNDFAGLVDEVRLYPYEISSFMVNQRYLDTKDGQSSNSSIPMHDLEVGDQWTCQITPNDGFTDGETSSTNTKTIKEASNTPPEASNLKIIPSSPLTDEDLLANYTYFDADGHSEKDSVISWFRDGAFVTAGALLPSNFTSGGEKWTFTVTPNDGFDYGTTVGPSTPVLIMTPEPTPSTTPTATPMPTSSPTPTSEPTPSPTPNPTPTITPTPTPIQSPSPSPTNTATPEPTLPPTYPPNKTQNPTERPNETPSSTPAVFELSISITMAILVVTAVLALFGRKSIRH